MRTLIAIVSLCLLSACRLSLDAAFDPLSCSDSYNHRGTTCDGGLGSVVIVVGPSRQYTDSGDAMCYQVSPVTATVQVGGSYSFQNNTNSTITIQGSDQSTWTTVGAGQTSSSLTFSSAGTYTFGVQGCRGISGTAWYGQLNVTP
ncbi:MAG TPA: hypothetical protein VGQ30_12410 [Gemmatimonadaceae bacterium]|jgi:hypothetical protein|nr:hypothetical protein [Gemmatimonadaceae bacterium]